MFDGSAAWTPGHALAVLEAKDSAGMLDATLGAIQASSTPVPREWLVDRLTAMWTMFMASRRDASPGSVTIWLAEYVRLLDDLPWDVVAIAIDGAIRAARHGFLPSVGEIRAISDPLVEERRCLLERLAAVADHAAAGANN